MGRLALLGAGRRAVGGAPVVWTTVLDQSGALNGTDDGDGNAGFTSLAILNPAALAASSGKTKARVTIRFGSSSGTTGVPETFYFGQGNDGGGEVFDFATTPVLVTFPVTVAPGPNLEYLSNEITLPEAWDATKPYILAWFSPVGSNASYAFATVGTGNSRQIAYKETGTSEASLVDKEGYNIGDNNAYFITKIEVAP